MKKYFGLFLLIITNFCFSQNYIPILSQTNEWYMHYVGLGFDIDNYYYTDDTIINNQTFAKFYEQTYNGLNMLGYLSEDTISQKFYFYNKDNNGGIVLSSQILIYSFNINVGDTVTVSSNWGSFNPSFVTSKLVLRKINNSQLAGGCEPIPVVMPTRRVFALTNPLNPQDTINWIEGTGSVAGVLSSGKSVCDFDIPIFLSCHSKNGVLIFKHANFNCTISAADISKNKNNQNKVLLYPNPTLTDIKVEILNAEYGEKKIEILDVLGRVIKTENIDIGDEQFTIQLLEIPKGLYMIQIGVKGQFFSNYFIKE